MKTFGFLVLSIMFYLIGSLWILSHSLSVGVKVAIGSIAIIGIVYNVWLMKKRDFL